MNKWLKRGLKTLGAIVVIFVGLMLIGYNMHTSAEEFVSKSRFS